jgi:hypothetical protein
VAAELRILDGSPVWASTSIVPSRDLVVTSAAGPSLAAISTTSQNVFVYVKVENVGTVDLGSCNCAVPLPSSWSGPTLFAGYRAGPPTSTTTQSAHGTTFTQGPSGDSISGSGFSNFIGYSPGERVWDWSPDGRFFAYASSTSAGGTDWHLTVIALQSVTRSNGTVIPIGGDAVSGASGLFTGAWNNAFFGWMRSKAVIVSGASPAGGAGITVACPEAPGSNVWGTLMPVAPGEVDWTFLSSPCGAVVALTPKILVQPNSRTIEVISTATAQSTQFKRNNVPTNVSITGPNPSITTVAHTANGVQIATGSGTVTVDDPDCTGAVGGSVMASVDRVKASTLPSANLGVLGVGSAAVSLIKAGQSAWVQVPNMNTAGWANQSEQHWCLLAQAYTSNVAVIPKPWDGQAVSPPPFPVTLKNCAQRNVMISP